MLVVELLHPLFQESSFDGMNNLLEELNKRSIASRTTKLWADVVIKSILNVLLFVRAERRRLAASCICCKFYDGIIFCRKTCELCPLWQLLQRVHRQNVARNSILFSDRCMVTIKVYLMAYGQTWP